MMTRMIMKWMIKIIKTVLLVEKGKVKTLITVLNGLMLIIPVKI